MVEASTSDGSAREGMAFESVLVDEAARANPLDLFIPLALAKRRVVLVGDHRQLPHVLEAKVERELETAAAMPDLASVLQLSLFEILFDRLLPNQTRLDGIARVVRLGTQHRMHPALGELVSRVFYGGHLKSGKDASHFGHSLHPFLGKPAAWVDVPCRTKADEETRTGYSKSRGVEAQAVAELIEQLLSQPSASGLTYGVMSFYTAQHEASWSALAGRGCAERLEDGSYEIAARLVGSADNASSRLSIGTVDGFQGKEFDVVLLSMTRSRRKRSTDVSSARGVYGYLTSPQRLCVAMTRQKKLLVVVGDAAMVRGALAEQVIRGLAEFRSLCEGPQGYAG
jgi:superfamily I DNA and/or RNA helicase